MSPATPPVFEARGLWRSYQQGHQSVAALSGVDLIVSQGEFLVLAGPSGSGKSTLLHLLAGLDRADRGDVLIAGRSLTTCSERDRTAIRRDQLGFVFQAFNLVPVLSAFENVEYGLWLQGVSRAERRDRVEEALRSVGLAERMGHRPDHLSGGERQRVALARALVHRPLAVIADEPTASLDSRTGGEVIDLLMTLNDRLGTTFVFATHDPAIIAKAPRVVRLSDGRIAEPVQA